MRIELLHIRECPNSAEAAERVRAALAGLGQPEAEVRMRLLRGPGDAAGTAFAGSPTITVDGKDIFADGAPTSDLACRIYRTPAGLAGMPTTDQIRDALRGRGF
jgi:hypothetical protein